MKAKEDKPCTKQVGGDDVRKGCPCKDKSVREHPHKNEGYKGVGKGDKSMPPMPKQDRNPGKHPHQGK